MKTSKLGKYILCFAFVIVVLYIATKRSETSHLKLEYSIQEDVLVNSSLLLKQHEPRTVEDWRHFNPAIQIFNSTYFYIGRVNKLVFEKLKGSKVHRIKVNRLFVAILDVRDGDYALNKAINFDPFYKNNQKRRGSNIRKGELSDNFDCELNPDWLDGGHGYQDPRLFVWANELYLLFNSRMQVNDGSFCDAKTKRAMFISRLKIFERSNELEVECDPPRMLELPKENSQTIEKNWSPIIYEDSLYFSYAFYPEHIVLSCNPSLDGDYNCHEKYRSSSRKIFHQILPNDNLKFHPHGGTPALVFQDQHRRHFYTGILHVKEDVGKIKVYKNYIYTLHGKPPFQITSIHPEPLNLNKRPSLAFDDLRNTAPSWYRSNYPFHHQIAFVCDMTHIPKQADSVLVTYGVSDAEARVVKVKLSI